MKYGTFLQIKYYCIDFIIVLNDQFQMGHQLLSEKSFFCLLVNVNCQ
jgi:hypothetical protein